MEDQDQIEYVTGLAEFDRLARDATFLEFVGLCDGVGADRIRGSVSLATSDASQAALAAHWIRRLSGSGVGYVLDFEPGQDVVELVRFWAGCLDVDHRRLRLRRRRFDQLRAGALRDPDLGVITVSSSDPVLGIRLRAWMDKARANLFRAAH